MPNVSVRVDDERLEELDTLASDAGLSRAEYIRDALDVREDYYALHEEHDQLRDDYDQLQSNYQELREEHEQLQAETDELRTNVERVQREKRQILDQRKECKELVKYVEHEKELQRRREERRDAPVWKRAKWWVVGRGDEQATQR